MSQCFTSPLLAIVALVSSAPPEAAGCTWSAAPSLRHARAAHAVVATDDAVYALAGTDQDGIPVLTVERFDGEAWRDEAELPGEGLNAPAAVAIGEDIYLIGGFGTITNKPRAEVHIYDTRAHTWSRGPDLPAPRGGHAAAVLDGRIHIVGGGNDRTTLADHLVLDPATGIWTEAAPLPRSLGSPAAVVAGGALWVIGGRSGPQDFGDVWRFEPSPKDGDQPASPHANLGEWIAGPPIEPRAVCGAVTLDDAIYLFGGESQRDRAVLSDVLRLDLAAESWKPVLPMPTARSFARAVLFKGGVLVVGGSPEPQRSHAPRGLSTVERLDRAKP